MTWVRRLTWTAVGLQVLLVVSGTAVRVTGSGLGCPTWPRCTGGSLTNTAELGSHGYIEFGNRLLAVLMELVGIALVLAVRRVPHPRSWTRLALVQAAVVPLQAVVGGLLVLSGLNPYVLILHFLASFPLVYAAVALLSRVLHATPLPPHPRDPRNLRPLPAGLAGGRAFRGSPEGSELHATVRVLTGLLVGAAALVLVMGTLVTGTGPHAGDPKVDRLPFSPRDVTQLHADAAYLLAGLVLAVLVVTWPTRLRPWALVLAALVVTQGAVGYWQYFTGVPAQLVAVHVALATSTFTVACWLQQSARPTAVPPGRSAQPLPATPTGTATAR